MAINRAEGYKAVYAAFNDINFTSFDYDTIKQSILEYLKQHYKENFNDFIESSELIAIIEIFAYVGELLAYRVDFNAHENFISTAELKENVLNLARLIAYKPTRNFPARGLVKITSVTTSKDVYDSNGTNLSGKTIKWNDENNSNWKEQFFIVLQSALVENFGDVEAGNRKQIGDIIYELYNINNVVEQLPFGVISYNVAFSSNSFVFELVPSKLSDQGVEERRPENNQNFSIVYLSDGLGDQSDYTGFFIYTKQGSLQKLTTTFDGVTPNQTFDIDVDNINETDIWLNEIDPATLETLNDSSRAEGQEKSGFWKQIDTVNGYNVIFNDVEGFKKYEVQTRDNDRITLVFGDGEFAEIPGGTFDIWYRVSANTDTTIPVNAITEIPQSIVYKDEENNNQTLSFTFSLVDSLQNSSSSEDIESIKRNAPAAFYSQNRIVNARDYNTFFLRDPSIIKLVALNRTFVGDSKYVDSVDVRGEYENTKIYNDDLSIFFVSDAETISVSGSTSARAIIENYIEPKLTDVSVYLKIKEITPNYYQKTLNDLEKQLIEQIIDDPLFLNGSVCYINHENSQPGVWWTPYTDSKYNTGKTVFIIEKTIEGNWQITIRKVKIRANSNSTKFWNTNDNRKIINFEDLKTTKDKIIVFDSVQCDSKREFLVTARVLISSPVNRDVGKRDIHQIEILSEVDSSGIPRDPTLSDYTITKATGRRNGSTVLLDHPYLQGYQEIIKSTIEQQVTNVVNSQRIVVFGNTQTINSQISEIKVNYTDGTSEFLSVASTSFNSGTRETTISTSQPYDTTRTIRTIEIDISDKIFENPNNTFLGDLSYSVYVTEPIDPVIDINVYIASFVYFLFDENKLPYEDLSEDRKLTFAQGNVNNVTLFNIVQQNQNVFVVSGNVENIVNNRTSIELIDQQGAREILAISSIQYNSNTDTTTIATVSNPSLTGEKIAVISNLDQRLNAENEISKRARGKSGMKFLWVHYTEKWNLINPSETNIIDLYVITRQYHAEYLRYLNGSRPEPEVATPYQLRQRYQYLLDNKMVSDTVVIHSGIFKPLFGKRAENQLQARFKVIKTEQTTKTDNAIKNDVVNAIRDFFAIERRTFGETIYFTDLAAYVITSLATDIASIVIVPTYQTNSFGDLFEISMEENEIAIADVTPQEIDIVESYNKTNIRQ